MNDRKEMKILTGIASLIPHLCSKAQCSVFSSLASRTSKKTMVKEKKKNSKNLNYLKIRSWFFDF